MFNLFKEIILRRKIKQIYSNNKTIFKNLNLKIDKLGRLYKVCNITDPLIPKQSIIADNKVKEEIIDIDNHLKLIKSDFLISDVVTLTVNDISTKNSHAYLIILDPCVGKSPIITPKLVIGSFITFMLICFCLTLIIF